MCIRDREKYQLIEEGDRIAVGVSGGKDSLFLLCALAELSQYYPKHFSVVAVTADPCFGGVPGDYSQIQGLCDSLGVPYIIRKTYLGPLIFEERKDCLLYTSAQKDKKARRPPGSAPFPILIQYVA